MKKMYRLYGDMGWTNEWYKDFEAGLKYARERGMTCVEVLVDEKMCIQEVVKGVK